jgi:hypothetical protein
MFPIFLIYYMQLSSSLLLVHVFYFRIISIMYEFMDEKSPVSSIFPLSFLFNLFSAPSSDPNVFQNVVEPSWSGYSCRSLSLQF